MVQENLILKGMNDKKEANPEEEKKPSYLDEIDALI